MKTIIPITLSAVCWAGLIWLRAVEYPRRFELFEEAQLKLPTFFQSVNAFMPFAVAISLAAGGIALVFARHRWGQVLLWIALVVIPIGLNLALVHGLLLAERQLAQWRQI